MPRIFKVPEGGREVYIKEPQTKNRYNPLLYRLLEPAKLRRSNPQVIFKFYLAQTSWSIFELSFLFYLLRKRPQPICTFEQSEFVSVFLFIKDVFAYDFDWQKWSSSVSIGSVSFHMVLLASFLAFRWPVFHLGMLQTWYFDFNANRYLIIKVFPDSSVHDALITITIIIRRAIHSAAIMRCTWPSSKRCTQKCVYIHL